MAHLGSSSVSHDIRSGRRLIGSIVAFCARSFPTGKYGGGWLGTGSRVGILLTISPAGAD
ncbi:hypothetical protein HGB07_00770 [Candidatus Roizmanbacteria bacterium]|nr:hypothetical protein [Candidatus Roizmanbacteria bacterium]